MEIFVFAVLLGLLPAYIASKKGRSFVGWWIFGFMLLIVALPVALLIKNDLAALEREKLKDGNKKCPFCAEFIKAQATVCKHCGRDLPDAKDQPLGDPAIVKPAPDIEISPEESQAQKTDPLG